MLRKASTLNPNSIFFFSLCPFPFASKSLSLLSQVSVYPVHLPSRLNQSLLQPSLASLFLQIICQFLDPQPPPPIPLYLCFPVLLFLSLSLPFLLNCSEPQWVPVHGLALLMVRGPMRGSESICPAPASLPLLLRLGCSIKVSERMVWVLCLWVNYGYCRQGTPERVNRVYCWERDEREKQKEGSGDTGQF